MSDKTFKGFNAVKDGVVTPEHFIPFIMILFISIVVLGGMGS